MQSYLTKFEGVVSVTVATSLVRATLILMWHWVKMSLTPLREERSLQFS